MKFDERKEPIIQEEPINPFHSIMEAWEQMTEEDWAEVFAVMEREEQQKKELANL